jgi:hypothetical protein
MRGSEKQVRRARPWIRSNFWGKSQGSSASAWAKVQFDGTLGCVQFINFEKERKQNILGGLYGAQVTAEYLSRRVLFCCYHVRSSSFLSGTTYRIQ